MGVRSMYFLSAALVPLALGKFSSFLIFSKVKKSSKIVFCWYGKLVLLLIRIPKLITADSQVFYSEQRILAADLPLTPHRIGNEEDSSF